MVKRRFCPHCGADQPGVGDRFCGVCREALDEPPELPPAGPPDELATRRAQARWSGALLVIAGSVGTITALFAVGTRDYARAIYTGVVSLIVLFVGLFKTGGSPYD